MLEKLISKRLILRPLKVSDATMMFNNWAYDDRVTKYLSWPSHQSVETTKKSLMVRKKKYLKFKYYDWGIVVKDTKELIGTITVVRQNSLKKIMELGFCIGYEWWGNGYTAETMKIVIGYLFQNTNVNWIEACHDKRNNNSGKVMRKSGMTYEGTFRQRGVNNMGICDEVVYSILRKDYIHRLKRPQSV